MRPVRRLSAGVGSLAAWCLLPLLAAEAAEEAAAPPPAVIEECQGAAVVLDRDCYGITISANVIAHEFGGGVHLVDAWGCAVSANTFTIVHQGGVIVGPNSGRIAITGNNFSDSFKGPDRKRDDPATGVVLQNAADVLVSGNVFSGMAGEAIERQGECRGAVVTGNLTVDLNVKAAEASK